VQTSYADDMHLILDAHHVNLFAAKEIFRRFSSATGLTINWGKFVASWISPHERPINTNILQWMLKQPEDPGEAPGFFLYDMSSCRAL
jgi:hypothetical protein